MILLLTFFFFVPPFFRYSRLDDDGIEECVIGDRKAACAQVRLLRPTQNMITDAATAVAKNDLDLIIFIAQEEIVYCDASIMSNTTVLQGATILLLDGHRSLIIFRSSLET